MSTTTCIFMENWRKLSQSYHQILVNKMALVAQSDARLTGDQEGVGSVHTRSSTFFCGG